MRRLKAYVTVFLFREGQVLLLRRSDRKAFAPATWTGVGGGVQNRERDDLERAVYREVREETGLRRRDLQDVVLRSVDARTEGIDAATIFFYSAHVRPGAADPSGPTEEGALHWMDPKEAFGLRMIPNARMALAEMLSAGTSGVRFSQSNDTPVTLPADTGEIA